MPEIIGSATEMKGVREHAEGTTVHLTEHKGRLCVEALHRDIDLLDLLAWLRANRPDLLEVRP